MPWKDKDKQRAAIKRHYYANRQAYIDKAKKRKKRIRDWVNSQKEASPCADCGVSYPYYVMDFDHVGEKVTEINKIIYSSSIAALTKEIEQCELVCSNCHRERTYLRSTTVSARSSAD